MALIRNGSHQLSGLSRHYSAYGAYGLRSALDSSGKLKNFNSGEHAVSNVTNKAAIPSGARHPIAWKMGTKSGSLSSPGESEGVGYAALSLASGRNVVGLSEGTTPTSEATLQLVVSMLGTISGTSTAEANILAALGMAGTSDGTSTVSALINALAWAIGQADGESTATLVRYATGELKGSISPFTELSPEGLAAAVLAAAQTTPIHADVKKVNSYTVTGTGATGNEWGPA